MEQFIGSVKMIFEDTVGAMKVVGICVIEVKEYLWVMTARESMGHISKCCV